jgi:hypothetical protein
MVLNHVPHCSGFLVILSTILYAYILGDGDLDVIYIATIPDRLKDAVAEAEHHDILDGFLAQVMVDTINLIFFERLIQLAVESHCRLEVMPKRLFDDDTRPAMSCILILQGKLRAGEPMRDLGIEAGRCSQIKDMIAAGATLLIQLREQPGQVGIAGRVVELRLMVNRPLENVSQTAGFTGRLREN